jgi:hypothetical protein
MKSTLKIRILFLDRKITAITFFCFLFQVLIHAQDVKDLPWRQRLFYGGDFELTLGSNTYINLSPIVGYKLTNRLSAGLGPIYIFEKYKLYNIQSSTYGGKAFASFIVIKDVDQYFNIGIKNILLHAENEMINIQKMEYVGTSYYALKERLWIDNVLAGAGLNMPFSERSGINIYVLWDITQNPYSPYSNPIIRLGFYF